MIGEASLVFALLCVLMLLIGTPISLAAYEVGSTLGLDGGSQRPTAPVAALRMIGAAGPT